MRDDGSGCDYTIVTEIPGVRGSREQLARLYARYRFASEYSVDKDILEVACGAGLGLGYLARYAKTVVGGDIDENNLQYARETYRGRENINIRHLDAQSLPFSNKSFDVVIFYEAIYYLDKPEMFIEEARRVLRDDGILIICTVNKEWTDFNPSPYSRTYFSGTELCNILGKHGFSDVALYGDCPVEDGRTKDKVISFIKRMAVAMHLIPRSMKGKELLKRIFMGRLVPLPHEVYEGMAEYAPPVSIDPDTPNTDYKVIFALGRTR